MDTNYKHLKGYGFASVIMMNLLISVFNVALGIKYNSFAYYLSAGFSLTIAIVLWLIAIVTSD